MEVQSSPATPRWTPIQNRAELRPDSSSEIRKAWRRAANTKNPDHHSRKEELGRKGMAHRTNTQPGMEVGRVLIRD